MSRRSAIWTALAVAAILALSSGQGCDSPTNPREIDTVTVLFKDGVSPLPTYLGTADAVIKNGHTYEIRNGNYGNLTVDTLGIVDLAGTSYERRLLVRFDLTSITDCGSVVSARLTLHVTPEDTNMTMQLEAYEATVPAIYPGSWVEGFGDPATGVTWVTLDGTDPWDNEGGDVIGLVDREDAGSDSTVVFELDAGMVAGWIKVPSLNHGILVDAGTALPEAYVHVHMREGTPSLRPELLVKYIKGG